MTRECQNCRYWQRFQPDAAERYTAYIQPGRCSNATDCGGGFMMTSITDWDSTCPSWTSRQVPTRKMRR